MLLFSPNTFVFSAFQVQPNNVISLCTQSQKALTYCTLRRWRSVVMETCLYLSSVCLQRFNCVLVPSECLIQPLEDIHFWWWTHGCKAVLHGVFGPKTKDFGTYVHTNILFCIYIMNSYLKYVKLFLNNLIFSLKHVRK